MADLPAGGDAVTALRQLQAALTAGRSLEAAALRGHLEELVAQPDLAPSLRFRLDLALAELALSGQADTAAARPWLAAARGLAQASPEAMGPLARAELAQLLAKSAKEDRRFDEAEVNYREALGQLTAGDDQVVRLRAIVLNNLGDLDLRRASLAAAAASFQNAVSLAHDPELRAASLQNYGRALQRLGRHHDAVEAYRGALALWRGVQGAEPRVTEVLANLVPALAGAGDYSGAEDAASEAIGLGGDAPEDEVRGGTALLNLAGQYRDSGLYQRAATAYEDALAKFRPNEAAAAEAIAVATDGLGGLAELTGHPAEAQRLMQEAITRFTEIDPAHPEIDVVEQSLAVSYLVNR